MPAGMMGTRDAARRSAGADCQPRLAGRLVFLFQPAEERGQGARAMIADRVLERFGIDEIYGLAVPRRRAFRDASRPADGDRG